MAAPRAIVISVDGLAAFYWTDEQARMPVLRRLAERGVVASGMETVFPSTTWPTHVSLVTGVRPERHGVVGNSILNRSTLAREDLTGDPVYHAFFLAVGAGIAQGRTVGTITSRDVAPTLARLLCVTMDGVEGRALDAVLA